MSPRGFVFLLYSIDFNLVHTPPRISAQIPSWEGQYGKTDRAELAWDIVETSDNNFVICGITY